MTQRNDMPNLDHSANTDLPSSQRQRLRKTLLAQRNQVPLLQRQQWDQGLVTQLLAWSRQRQIRSMGVYWPIHAEPDLRAAYPALQQMGVQLALPWVTMKAAPLSFLQWAPGDAMDVDDYGIPVPRQRQQIIAPEVLLIPCVGFNTARFRLGYGGGFYDRTLALSPRPFALGVAYQLSRAEFIAQEHDVAMDAVLTEA